MGAVVQQDGKVEGTVIAGLARAPRPRDSDVWHTRVQPLACCRPVWKIGIGIFPVQIRIMLLGVALPYESPSSKNVGVVRRVGRPKAQCGGVSQDDCTHSASLFKDTDLQRSIDMVARMLL